MMKRADQLQGWAAIARFLGQPVATAQRWAKSAMPVAKQGRYVYASKDELSHWLGREAGTQEAVRIASENEELVPI